MQVTTIGLDLAKNVFQVHAIDANEKVVARKQLRRNQVISYFKALPPCVVGMEACATGHYWARELAKLGHEVRLMPAKDVKAYVKRNKNDAADAEAICEAVRRPTMRFVRVKSAEQQGRLMQHRTRDLLMRQRTQLINALRSHLAELGVAAAQGREGLKELLAVVADTSDDRLSIDARASLMVLAAQLQALQTLIGAIEKQNLGAASLQRGEPATRDGPRHRPHRCHHDCSNRYGSQGLPIRSRLRDLDRGRAATGLDRRQAEARACFQARRPLSATHSRRRSPRGSPTRQTASGQVSLADQLSARRPFKVVAVALANKMARIAWALLAKGGTYRAPALTAA